MPATAIAPATPWKASITASWPHCSDFPKHLKINFSNVEPGICLSKPTFFFACFPISHSFHGVLGTVQGTGDTKDIVLGSRKQSPGCKSSLTSFILFPCPVSFAYAVCLTPAATMPSSSPCNSFPEDILCL